MKQSNSNIAVWFDIPAINFERSVAFYQTILEVEIDCQDVNGMKMGLFPHDDLSAVSGSIVCGMGFQPSENGSVVYLNGGDDLNGILSKVEGAGGNILVPKTHLGDDIGHIAHFIDIEGNRVALHSMN